MLEITGISGTANGRRLSECQPCYFCDAEVTFEETDGILHVMEGSRPSRGAYVKVFAGGGGMAPRFYKDGYTDRLGAFNYVSLNAKSAPVKRDCKFAVLVVTKECGAMVREVIVPPMERRDGGTGGVDDLWVTPNASPAQAHTFDSDGSEQFCGEGEESEGEL